jgi:BirA family transcriptional regulator, biotin operon repressor / biotin---[acetyl-CoA-carboxylase] ligase
MPEKLRFGQNVLRLEVTDTTMREAAEWAERNAPEGTLILAEEQTAGRGRLGRTWISERGLGLYGSLILRPTVPPAQATIITLVVGLGVARGVGEAAGRQCDIRWPNDVLLNDKKCCGVLVELSAEPDRVQYAIAGFGINVNHESMPPDLAGIATSLRIETGCEFVRQAVLDAVLKHTERYYDMFMERGTPAVLEAFSRASTYVRGRRVIVETGERKLAGTTAGLNAAGLLLLETDQGRVEPVLTGSVRRWQPDPAVEV